MGEVPIMTVGAHVFHIDPKTKKQWLPLSTKAVQVSFYQDTSNNINRVICVHDSKVLINSTLTAATKFTKTSCKFGQWMDHAAATVYGVGFDKESDLDKFAEMFLTSLSPATNAKDKALQSKKEEDLPETSVQDKIKSFQKSNLILNNNLNNNNNNNNNVNNNINNNNNNNVVNPNSGMLHKNLNDIINGGVNNNNNNNILSNNSSNNNLNNIATSTIISNNTKITTNKPAPKVPPPNNNNNRLSNNNTKKLSNTNLNAISNNLNNNLISNNNINNSIIKTSLNNTTSNNIKYTNNNNNISKKVSSKFGGVDDDVCDDVRCVDSKKVLKEENESMRVELLEGLRRVKEWEGEFQKLRSDNTLLRTTLEENKRNVDGWKKRMDEYHAEITASRAKLQEMERLEIEVTEKTELLKEFERMNEIKRLELLQFEKAHEDLKVAEAVNAKLAAKLKDSEDENGMMEVALREAKMTGGGGGMRGGGGKKELLKLQENISHKINELYEMNDQLAENLQAFV